MVKRQSSSGRINDVTDVSVNGEPATIQVYLDTGAVFEYDIYNPTLSRIREHITAIQMWGYRSEVEGSLVAYPVHRIRKVVCNHPIASKGTKYPDRERAT